ncbi:hypothetical protein [Bartonella sp. AC134YNZD]|uniref:hypothetical protein n=1 Tax=Bartonella sp. AC134YNZD TaxID=3243446 RepID=UPI0035D126D2
MPFSYRYEQEQKFMMLKQGDGSVAAYEAEFTRLSHFSPDLVQTDDSKCRRECTRGLATKRTTQER